MVKKEEGRGEFIGVRRTALGGLPENGALGCSYCLGLLWIRREQEFV